MGETSRQVVWTQGVEPVTPFDSTSLRSETSGLDQNESDYAEVQAMTN